ncbi:hypothetical protein GGF31_006182 [Allomyces arbusculus]|nr:hypothetical protein GGF31_006182 [Allomyces arbusculus]
MTRETKTAHPRQATHDRHVARNGAERDVKKSGGGKSNWGSYEDEFEEAIEEVRGEKLAESSHRAPVDATQAAHGTIEK